MISQKKPQLVKRPRYGRWEVPAEVADFSEEQRPAYRVGCHCRNCSWEGEMRAPVGEKIQLWAVCPKCETRELSAHGEFLGRDEVSREEEAQRYQETMEERRETAKKIRGSLGVF